MYDDLLTVIDVFWTLNRSRPYNAMSGTPLPISLVEVKAWLELFPVSDIREFIERILILDSEYIDFYHKKAEAEEAKEKDKASRKKGNVRGRPNNRRID